jgi:hypothetical protein
LRTAVGQRREPVPTTVQAAGRLWVGESKTEAGVRHVDLLPGLRDELTAYKAGCSRTEPGDYVFATSAGRRHGIDNIRNRVFDRAVERANKCLVKADKTPLPDGLTPHKLRHTFASLLVALGEDPGYVMDQIGHTNPNFTLRVYRHGMRRDDGEKERLRALVEGVDWAPMGTNGDSDGRGSETEAGSGSEKPRDSGAFAEADDGTRTHDLLHGKQTL